MLFYFDLSGDFMRFMVFKCFVTNLCIYTIKTFSINICMSKHEKEVLEILKKDEIKSTNEILKELEKKTGNVINWHLLYRLLRDLVEEGKVEKLKAKAGFFWKKK